MQRRAMVTQIVKKIEIFMAERRKRRKRGEKRTTNKPNLFFSFFSFPWKVCKRNQPIKNHSFFFALSFGLATTGAHESSFLRDIHTPD